MNKAGIELAINTIVMLILGLAMLGIVISLVTNIGEGGSELIAASEEEKNELIASSRCSNDLQRNGICVYPKVQELDKGETASYLIWVSNIFGEEIAKIVITNTTECQGLKGLFKTESGNFVIDDNIPVGEDLQVFPVFISESNCSFKVDVITTEGETVATETFFIRI
ncbi:MAG: hypothetical protein PWR30_126 [Candidatus Woesearchaeota archaeon]|nr:hypothetical protein [Candidatus Woesearchaeota archaeon]